MTIVVDAAPSAWTDHLRLIGPLSTAHLGALDRGILPDTGCCSWNNLIHRVELRLPGMYAFVSVVPTQPPDDPAEFETWLSSQPISAARIVIMTAAPPRAAPSTDAGGDGGRYLTMPVLAGLVIEAWAASGSVALAVRRRRRSSAMYVVVTLVIGVASAGVLAGLAMLAVTRDETNADARPVRPPSAGARWATRALGRWMIGTSTS